MAFRSVTNLLFSTITVNRSTIYTSRTYARWTHRTPARVLLPPEAASTSLKSEKIIDLGGKTLEHDTEDEETNIKTQKSYVAKSVPNPSQGSANNNIETDLKHEQKEKFKIIKEKRLEKIKTTKFSLKKQPVFDEENEIIYEKCKDNDGRISSLLIKLKSRKQRIESEQVLVEGWRLIVDGLAANCKLNYIIFSDKNDLVRVKPFLPKIGVKIYKIPYKEIKLFSDVDTPSGMLGVFEMPKSDSIKVPVRPFPIQIICDNIRVPGNLGSIMRVAAGAGCQRLLCMKGCVDHWDQKVLRSGAGAHFRIPVHSGITWDEMDQYVTSSSTVLIADSNATCSKTDETHEEEQLGPELPLLPYYGVDYSTLKHISLIIGGETEGISEDCFRYASSKSGMRLNIPLHRGVDSLNTASAAAVIAFEIKKQLLLAYTKASREKTAVFLT